MRSQIMATILLAVMVVALFVGGVLVAPVGAKRSQKLLRCELSIEVNWAEGKWLGTVAGDIEGSIALTPGEAHYPGKTEHFFETWVVEGDDGSVLEGFDEGVWRFQNCKWVSNGRVTVASGTLSHLTGARMHTSGTTSEFLGPGNPLTGTGILLILPSN